MKSFLADLFTRYGGKVSETDGHVEVELPPTEELARRFGRDKLSLVFDPHEARSGVDLVAPGGHILRTIEEFLATRGRRSYVVAPRAHKLEKARVTEALAPGAGKSKLKKPKLAMEERSEEEAWDAHFTFRLRYRGRERKDALLDAMVPVRSSGLLEPRPEPPPAESATWESHPRKRIPEDKLKAAFAKAIVLVDELASKEAVDLEARARARLEKDASRLELFYDTAVVEQQTNRLATDVAQMKIEELEQERLLKRKELVESARVEAEAEPLQLLVVERPRRHVLVRVERPRGKGAGTGAETADKSEPARGQVELAFDLSTGEIEAPACPACSKRLSGVNVCDGGHVVHADCAEECATCERVVCLACGATKCARGGELVGPECEKVCEGCGDRVCREHMGACKVCGGARCTGCLHLCAHCRGHVCEGHRLRLVLEDTEASAFLCTECGEACPGCGRPEPKAALGRCEVCGRHFCSSCLPLKKGETACLACRGGKSEGR